MHKMCQENCGVAAICCRRNQAAKKVGQALLRLQNRGTRYAGRATYQEEEHSITCEVHPGLVKANQALFETTPSDASIGHVSQDAPQPVSYFTRMGEICLAFSGCIANYEEIRQQAIKDGQPFTSRNQAELLIWLICQSGDDPVAGLKHLAERAKGAYAIVLLTDQGIYGMRDPLGVKPLIMGNNQEGYGVVSESPALTEIGMKVFRDFRPGEIIYLNGAGLYLAGQVPSGRVAHCAMEYANFARMDSVIDGVPVHQVRLNLGASLARGDNVKADIVAPIPKAGVGVAEGYHSASGLRYLSVVYHNPFAGRSNLRLNPEERRLIGAEKFSLIDNAVSGQNIVLGEDTIKYGVQVPRLVARLRAAGAKEVHLRVGVPPIIGTCPNSPNKNPNNDELVFKSRSFEEIQRILGVDSLRFNSPEDFVAAIGLPREQLCLGCITGEYPQ